jgi:histidinol dehydrogenase
MKPPLLKRYSLSDLDQSTIEELCERPKIDFMSIFETVGPIIEDVDEEGDEAVRRYTKKFDKADTPTVCMPVPDDEPILDPRLKESINVAYDNIYAFHSPQLGVTLEVETMPGVVCRRVARPIERVGIYVPGGTAILPSSALMLGVPAQIAGCKTVVLATPPRPDGSVAPEIIYIAQKCGVTHILLAGGAQAVAAMALGTETVPKVDKILGPGNQYVTAAKMLLQNTEAMVAIDMPAGPSEVLVIADASANPEWVAADLLSQAEHGIDSQVVVIAVDGFDLDRLEDALETQLESLPRAGVARQALGKSYALHVSTSEKAVMFSNVYAPEHLIMQTSDASLLVDYVVNAGSVFVGHWTPESVGDYASGTNHTLPTYGYARMYSGVSVDSFVRKMTVQELTEDGLRLLGPHVVRLAKAEGLDAHANAVTIRILNKVTS